MPTLILDPPPFELEQLVEQRRKLGQDRFDEVWAGVLHMNPNPSGAHMDLQQQLTEILGPLARAAGLFPRLAGVNIGALGDFRVPDGVIQRERRSDVWHPTAALAVEIVSPGDESWDKLPFYADHGVDELLVVDPASHELYWFVLSEGEYRPTDRSHVVDLGPAQLLSRIDWPTLD
jgi:Uma2 family endonuclease